MSEHQGAKELNYLKLRELPPVPYWSASVTIDAANIEQLQQILAKSATDTGLTYSGFLTTKEDGKLAYTFSRYPRLLFNPPTDEQVQTAVSTLRENLSAAGVQADIATESGAKPEGSTESDFRVLLGLQEGYDKNEKIHTLDEVRQQVGEETSLTKASICSVGPWGSYTEPAVVIEGLESQIPNVYRAADTFHQSRLAVENRRTGQAFMVETRHCTDPDPEPENSKLKVPEEEPAEGMYLDPLDVPIWFLIDYHGVKIREETSKLSSPDQRGARTTTHYFLELGIDNLDKYKAAKIAYPNWKAKKDEEHRVYIENQNRRNQALIEKAKSEWTPESLQALLAKLDFVVSLKDGARSFPSRAQYLFVRNSEGIRDRMRKIDLEHLTVDDVITLSDALRGVSGVESFFES